MSTVSNGLHTTASYCERAQSEMPYSTWRRCSDTGPKAEAIPTTFAFTACSRPSGRCWVFMLVVMAVGAKSYKRTLD